MPPTAGIIMTDTADKPQRVSETSSSRMDATTENAKTIIAEQRAAQDAKTARLRAARLAHIAETKHLGQVGEREAD